MARWRGGEFVVVSLSRPRPLAEGRVGGDALRDRAGSGVRCRVRWRHTARSSCTKRREVDWPAGTTEEVRPPALRGLRQRPGLCEARLSVGARADHRGDGGGQEGAGGHRKGAARAVPDGGGREIGEPPKERARRRTRRARKRRTRKRRTSRASRLNWPADLLQKGSPAETSSGCTTTPNQYSSRS